MLLFNYAGEIGYNPGSQNFNTSNITIQLKASDLAFNAVCISIHLMLLFNLEEYEAAQLIVKFQYI